MKNIKQKKSGKWTIWIGIIVALIFINILSNLSDKENVEHIQTDKNNEYSKLTGNIYRNTKYNFRIKFPEGWKIEDGKGIHIVQKASFKNSMICVIVHSGEFKRLSSIKDIGTSKEFIDAIIEGAKEKVSDVKIINYGETKIDNEPAYWVEYSSSSQILNHQLKMMDIMYYIAKGNTMYSISGGTTTDEYSNMKPLFMQTVSTFILEDN